VLYFVIVACLEHLNHLGVFSVTLIVGHPEYQILLPTFIPESCGGEREKDKGAIGQCCSCQFHSIQQAWKNVNG
jgi:hypothetical protein